MVAALVGPDASRPLGMKTEVDILATSRPPGNAGRVVASKGVQVTGWSSPLLGVPKGTQASFYLFKHRARLLNHLSDLVA